MKKIHCNWQCTPLLHKRAALLLCALHAQVSLRTSQARLLYSKLFSDNPVRPTMLREPTSLLFNQHRGYSPGPKQPGHEDNHSPQSIAKVRNSCSYTSTSPICLYSMDKKDIFHSLTSFFYAILYPKSFPSYPSICCLCHSCQYKCLTRFKHLHAVYFILHCKLNPFFETKHQHLTH